MPLCIFSLNQPSQRTESNSAKVEAGLTDLVFYFQIQWKCYLHGFTQRPMATENLQPNLINSNFIPAIWAATSRRQSWDFWLAPKKNANYPKYSFLDTSKFLMDFVCATLYNPIKSLSYTHFQWHYPFRRSFASSDRPKFCFVILMHCECQNQCENLSDVVNAHASNKLHFTYLLASAFFDIYRLSHAKNAYSDFLCACYFPAIFQYKWKTWAIFRLCNSIRMK